MSNTELRPHLHLSAEALSTVDPHRTGSALWCGIQQTHVADYLLRDTRRHALGREPAQQPPYSGCYSQMQRVGPILFKPN